MRAMVFDYVVRGKNKGGVIYGITGCHRRRGKVKWGFRSGTRALEGEGINNGRNLSAPGRTFEVHRSQWLMEQESSWCAFSERRTGFVSVGLQYAHFHEYETGISPLSNQSWRRQGMAIELSRREEEESKVPLLFRERVLR
jgi:hypothetical protein